MKPCSTGLRYLAHLLRNPRGVNQADSFTPAERKNPIAGGARLWRIAPSNPYVSENNSGITQSRGITSGCDGTQRRDRDRRVGFSKTSLK